VKAKPELAKNFATVPSRRQVGNDGQETTAGRRTVFASIHPTSSGRSSSSWRRRKSHPDFAPCWSADRAIEPTGQRDDDPATWKRKPPVKKLLADLSLDEHMLAEAREKKGLAPVRRRELAAWFMTSHDVAAQRACHLAAFSHTASYRRPHRDQQWPVRHRIRELAEARPKRCVIECHVSASPRAARTREDTWATRD
jgi:hypothetical protein